MSIKTDSTNTTKTSHGKMRFTRKVYGLARTRARANLCVRTSDARTSEATKGRSGVARALEPFFGLSHLTIEQRLASRGGFAPSLLQRARFRRGPGGRAHRLWLACRHVRSFVDQLVRVHELVPKLVGGPAELADHTADVPRHPGHPLRSEHDEGDDQKEQQLARAYAEHQPLTVADARATFAASRSDRAAASAARSTSPSWAPYRTVRDAETSTPPPRTSSAAPIAIPTSPPCAPTPGMRNRRSGASARSRRASSG